MPLRDDLPEDDQEPMDWWQFPDCSGCANRMKKRVCGSCVNGDEYEEPEPEGIDSLFNRSAW
jgi:hypothetical protein